MKTITIFMCCFLLLFFSAVFASDKTSLQLSKITKNIMSEGSCAVVEMTAEECQLLALQRARAYAIERASGVEVVSGTLVTNGALAIDFIKTYSKGYIVNEKVEWLPLDQYQKNKTTAPIPEYTVKIIADVYSPEKKIKPLGLNVKLNSVIFQNGDNARIDIKVKRKAKIAVFNIMANDKIVMLFPNDYEKNNIIPKNIAIKFPADNSKTELTMQTLPGHKRDAEAFFIAAMDAGHKKDFTDVFALNDVMSFSTFFRKYTDVSDFCEDTILTYEVVNNRKYLKQRE